MTRGGEFKRAVVSNFVVMRLEGIEGNRFSEKKN